MMMEAVHTSEMSVYFYETTECHITEGCHLHTYCFENLKSHLRKTHIYGIQDNEQANFVEHMKGNVIR
jgi:hypothetical protein